MSLSLSAVSLNFSLIKAKITLNHSRTPKKTFTSLVNEIYKFYLSILFISREPVPIIIATLKTAQSAARCKRNYTNTKRILSIT